MSNDGIAPQTSQDTAANIEHLNNILNDLKSSDVQICYNALISLKVALEKGPDI